MLLNSVDDELNKKIKAKRLTDAEKVYFEILGIYGNDVMNAAKH